MDRQREERTIGERDAEREAEKEAERGREGMRKRKFLGRPWIAVGLK